MLRRTEKGERRRKKEFGGLTNKTLKKSNILKINYCTAQLSRGIYIKYI